MLAMYTNFTDAPAVELSVKKVASPMDEELKKGEVVIKVEAAPINPSDIAKMFQMAPSSMTEGKDKDGNPTLTLKTDNKGSQAKVAKSAGLSIALGNEGAGTVVKAGPGAEGLLGKVVGVAGGAMYAEYQKAHARQCIPHLDGTTPREAASSFVNPMTVLCMVETMSMEGHNAIIHTAAASSLGQMLQKVCLERDIPLVNVVRKQVQEDILKKIGAKYIVRSDKPSFFKDLVAAITETKASLCFDAIGGGEIQDTILTAMEKAANVYGGEDTAATSFYGTSVMKQLYVYGGLQSGPLTLNRGYGMSWSIGGYLMPRVLAKLKPEQVKAMYGQVAKGIKTTFKSEYVKEIGLKEAVQQKYAALYAKQETGKKYLVNPTL